MSPPVQLVDYVVEQFEFKVNPVFRLSREEAAAALEKDEVSLNLELDWTAPRRPPEEALEDLGIIPGGIEVFNLELTINVNDQEDFAENGLYRIRLKLDGILQRTSADQIEDVEEKEYLKHSVASGVSILYGAARNVISSMTAQSPYEKLVLPSISPGWVTTQAMEPRRKRGASDEDAAAPAR